MILRHLRLSAGTLALCCLTAVSAWGHPGPYGDTYSFSAENFPNSFGVVSEPETGQVFDFGTPDVTLTFDGIAEDAGQMMVNERAVVWPGKFGITAVNVAGIDGQTTFDLPEWQNPGEVLEFSFDTKDGAFVSDAPFSQSSFNLKGIDWSGAAAGDTPFFYETGFYFYFADDGVPIANMAFVLADTGVLVGPHPFDPSVPEVAYIAYSRGQVDDVTDEYAGGVDIKAGTRQLDENQASWAILQQVLSITPASGNGLRVGYLVDIDTEINAASGDFNGDDVVDTIDYDILRNNFRQPGLYSDGDINIDGTVDLADFIDFRKSYELANGAPLRTVPEPSAWALATLAGGILLTVRYRRAARRMVAGLAPIACAFAAASEVSAQDVQEYLWVPGGPAAVNWNVAENWNPQFIPDQTAAEPFFGIEYAVISNGGRAFIDDSVSTPPVAGIILGRAAGQTGAVEIRSGGTLSVVQEQWQSEPEHGIAYVGQFGTGIVDVLPGGTFAAHQLSVGGQNSQLNVSGNGSVVVETIARLGKTTKISGSSVNFTAADLNLGGTLIAELSPSGYSPIVVSNHANLITPTLKVEGAGFTPAYGAEYAVVDAATMSGTFTSLDTSAAPALAEGLQYRVVYGDGSANLKVDNTLVLVVDPDSGDAAITNVVGASISLNGYSILSDNDLLTGAFTGLGAGWQNASPTPSAISQLNLLGSATVNVGASLTLGNLIPGGVAEELRDLVFEYSSNGELRQGIVSYEPISTPGLLGDTNDDGVVDIVDLNNVRNNFGSIGLGDTDGNGTVDITDLNNVRNNFGATLPGGANAVPEPSTWGLAACGALALGWVARRKRP